MKLLLYFLSIFIYPFWFLIPIVPNRWSCAAWGGRQFSDNPKSLFEYIQVNEANINCVYIIKKKGFEFNYGVEDAYRFKTIWHLMTSETLIFTHSAPYDFLKFFVNPKSLKCLTWHGRTVKKIGNLLPVSRFENVKKIIVPMLREQVDLTICLHDSEKVFLKDAFSIFESDIFTTGYPRNDKMVKKDVRKNNIQFKPKLRILYVPTYRGTKESDAQLEQYICEFVDIAEVTFTDSSVEIECKLHPSHKAGSFLKDKINNSTNFYFSKNIDQFENTRLLDFDVLITDYSSILFDYMLLKRPYLLFQPDFEYYMLRNKGFVKDPLITELFINNNSLKCTNSHSLVSRLAGIKENNLLTYSENLEHAHQFVDDRASSRVIEAIRSKLIVPNVDFG